MNIIEYQWYDHDQHWSMIGCWEHPKLSDKSNPKGIPAILAPATFGQCGIPDVPHEFLMNITYSVEQLYATILYTSKGSVELCWN